MHAQVGRCMSLCVVTQTTYYDFYAFVHILPKGKSQQSKNKNAAMMPYISINNYFKQMLNLGNGKTI